MMAGKPKFPANVVMNLVLNLGSFLPYQYPIPIVKKTGNNTSKSFAIKSNYNTIESLGSAINICRKRLSS